METVLQALGETGLPRPVVAAIVRRELQAVRKRGAIPPHSAILQQVRGALELHGQGRLQPVINGTGVLVHTNLGRAPLGPEVVATLLQLAAEYNNLEFDLASGNRGQRGACLEHNLAILCGAEAATVVNNCAAALVLILRHLARPPKHEVIISRGELVQIGGGFRIPEILEASGAALREVGTTNQTSVADYAKAIGPATALILKVHRSNFFMAGFVESPATEEIAALARKHRLPLVEDLGSGAVVDTREFAAGAHEPTPGETLKRGVDLVTCSGDKLLGGPQAGIIAGKARLVAAVKREPFFRALRCDKLILGALQTTVDLYLSGQAHQEIPLLAMLQVPNANLRQRAEKLVNALRDLPLKAAVVAEGSGRLGGGTLPQAAIPSVVVALRPMNQPAAELAQRVRWGTPPLIGYVSGGAFKLDLRTIFPHHDIAVVRILRAAVGSAAAPPHGD